MPFTCFTYITLFSFVFINPDLNCDFLAFGDTLGVYFRVNLFPYFVQIKRIVFKLSGVATAAHKDWSMPGGVSKSDKCFFLVTFIFLD